jgi:DNA-binding transcriptional ArsR family regulator
MKDPMQPKRCAELLGALAAPERLQIVRLLRGGPKNVSELAQLMKSSLVNVSHHQGVLRHAALVRNKKHGRFVVYSLAPGVLQEEDAAHTSEHLDLGCCRLEIPKSK